MGEAEPQQKPCPFQVIIGGRAAVPARAIPLMTDYHLWPSDVVDMLRNPNAAHATHEEAEAQGGFFGIFIEAHHPIGTGQHAPIPPRHWNHVAGQMRCSGRQVQAAESAPWDLYHEQLLSSLEMIPAEAFVWLDELEVALEEHHTEVNRFPVRPAPDLWALVEDALRAVGEAVPLGERLEQAFGLPAGALIRGGSVDEESRRKKREAMKGMTLPDGGTGINPLRFPEEEAPQTGDRRAVDAEKRSASDDDATLGRQRRNQLTDFARTRGADAKVDAKETWRPFVDHAKGLRREKPTLSKSRAAQLTETWAKKEGLGFPGTVNTLRRKL